MRSFSSLLHPPFFNKPFIRLPKRRPLARRPLNIVYIEPRLLSDETCILRQPEGVFDDMLGSGGNVPDGQDSRELEPDEAITRLGEALETCRSVVADYRAALIANRALPAGTEQIDLPGDREL